MKPANWKASMRACANAPRPWTTPRPGRKCCWSCYERFFKVALKKEAERLGIVYTPIEVVDFILHSADHALQQHFGRRLTGEDVHILDPFTGTGTFIVRLLQNPELIRDEDLVRKFQSELHANEIVLLAYYIAAINIEEAYHGRRGMETAYAPFDSIVFTDTFTLGEDEGQFAETFPINSERVERQQGRDITVIVGNPPYSIGQKSTTDENPNVSYPHLAGRVKETYVAQSKAGLKISLYDSYKLAIRWASDRIENQGIIAFVTNASFIDGNAESGLRACLAEEFSHLYVFNLRGNQYTQGERSRQEGGKIFGSGSRLPVAIMVLVRDPAHQGECQTHYKDIGDYLSRDEKLRIIREGGAIAGISDWQRITPDKHHDWVAQRDVAYQRFTPIGIKSKKFPADVPAVFSLLFWGIKTNRDSWVYNFSSPQLYRNIQTMAVSMNKRRQLCWLVKRRQSKPVGMTLQRRSNGLRPYEIDFSVMKSWKQEIVVSGEACTAPFANNTSILIPSLLTASPVFPQCSPRRTQPIRS